MNKEKWDESKFNFCFHFKNNICYHLIAVAAVQYLVEFSTYVPIAPKTKRGRKSKAAKALERNVDLNEFFIIFMQLLLI